MSIGREPPPLESPPAVQARGWAELLAELLNGMAHTLNNRAATVRAVHALLSGDGGGSPALPLLEQEAGQLESIVALLRLAGGRARPQPEPFVPGDVLRDAATLYRQHDLLRDVPLSLEPRARSAALAHAAPLTHALLVLLDAAGRHAARHGGALRAGAYDASDVVELVVALSAATDVDGLEAQALSAAAPLASAAGAGMRARRTEHELQLVLSVPTLYAARTGEAAPAPPS